MSETKDWPHYMPDVLHLGDPDSPVAICTLWMEIDKLVKLVGKESTQKAAIIGNLYSKRGINYILRNILLKPTIRRIVLVGDGKSGSGQALRDFFDKGLDDKNNIIGHPDGPIETEISTEAVMAFRQNIELIDLRSVSAEERKDKIIEALDFNGSPEPWRESESFPDPEPLSTDVFPFENTGLKVEGKTISELWLRLLDNFIRFGTYYNRVDEYEYREIMNVIGVVTDEDPDDPYLPDWLPLTKEQLENYYPEVCSAKVPEGTKYTYGQRIHAYDGDNNQIETIIDRLKKKPDSRGVICVLWDPSSDQPSANQDSLAQGNYVAHKPCLILFQAIVHRGKVYATSYWRAHNIYRAYHLNVFAMRKLQKHIATELGLPMGPLTTISYSARTREDDITLAAQLVDEHLPKLPCRQDPRGIYLITINHDTKKILVKHLTPDGSQELEKFEVDTTTTDKPAMQLFNEMCQKHAFSEMVHATDIGAELQKAEIALSLEIDYVQDQPLKLKK